MARSRRLSSSIGLLLTAAFALASFETPTLAQQAPPGGKSRGTARHSHPGGQAGCQLSRRAAATFAKLGCTTAFRVYQRDVNGKADIPIVLDDSDQGWQVVERGRLRQPPATPRSRSTRPNPS